MAQELDDAPACRNLGSEEQALQADEQALLDQICKAYYLPQWCSINDYQRLMEAKGLQDIRTADWSEEVAPFWGAVIRSALSLEGFKGLFTAGLKTIKVSLSGRVSIIACHVGLQQCGSWWICTSGLRPPQGPRLLFLQVSRWEQLQKCQGRDWAHDAGLGHHRGGTKGFAVPTWLCLSEIALVWWFRVVTAIGNISVWNWN